MAVHGHEQAQQHARNDAEPLNKGGQVRKPEVPSFDFVGPKEFGRLLLLKAIARGGMGEVYLAAMGDIEGAERPCVVKIIRREHADDSSFLARFTDEARIQAQMQHPGVAQVLEAAIGPEGKPYVVVEYVAGRDLGEIRHRSTQLKLPIMWHDAVAIAISIADALLHVHERTDPAGKPLDVAHRDLSPQNIMVGYGGEIKLIDFGTARGENRRCQTINGVVFAKPGYVAPEVAANTPGAAPADLYALGIVLWELVAGRRFLQGDSKEHLAQVARGEKNPPALGLWCSVPPELDTIIARLTAPRLSDRYESARDAMSDLLRVLNQAPSLANGERGVRARVAHLMLRLYPSEPARSRAEFARLVAEARKVTRPSVAWPHSPAPGGVESTREPLLSGTRYRIQREIAKSQNSIVYEAEHVDLGRKVALKVLKRERSEGSELDALFRNEARVVARLHHENLVQIHDFGITNDGRPYYAMEYLQGETLAARIAAKGRLPWREALEIMVPVCRALEAAHTLGVVHRDIKPANLFLTESGNVKLLDFGITQVGSTPARQRDMEPLALTGTPEYMAPEQVGQQGVDARADIYALGAVLYETLSGCLPHAGPNTVSVLDKKLRERVTPPSRKGKRQKLPKYLDRVVLAALAIDPKDRYQNVSDLKLDLMWILGSSERSRAFGRRLAIGAAALSAAALSTLLLSRGPYVPVEADLAAAAPALVAPDNEPAPATAPSEALVNAEPEAHIQALQPEPEAPSATPEPPAPPATSALATDTPGVQHAPASEERSAAPADVAGPADTDADEGSIKPTPKPKSAPAPRRPLNPRARKALENGLAKARALIEEHRDLRALEAFRRLNEEHPGEPQVLAGWSKIAAQTRWWGEALRAAERWVEVDGSSSARLHLARTLRSVGRVEDSIAALRELVSKNPSHREAKELLRRYGGDAVAMRQ
jgi:eukaryotic-like serine/threonine-protein kinase